MPIVNRYLLSEVFDALVDNKWMTEKQAMQTIIFIEAICLLTVENVVYRLSPDPKDNYLFDLAVQHNCPLIISDDTELLAFVLKPVKVKSCNWFLKHFPV
jgi:predicted nucleic acid-binding protein